MATAAEKEYAELESEITKQAPSGELWLWGKHNATHLPPIPEGVKKINMGLSSLLEFPTFPDSLEELTISNNSNFTVLPTSLPSNLKLLYLSNLPLTTIDELPSTLNELHLADCRELRSLPRMPSTLQTLKIYNCPKVILPSLENCTQLKFVSLDIIEKLENLDLPDSVEKIMIHGRYDLFTELTFNHPLPSHLKVLLIEETALTSIPGAFPVGLERIFITKNENLTNLPAIPEGVKILSIANNKLRFIPHLPTSLETGSKYDIYVTGNPLHPMYTTIVQRFKNTQDHAFGAREFVRASNQLLEKYRALQKPGRNLEALRLTLASPTLATTPNTATRLPNVPNDAWTRVGTMLSGRPGTLQMQRQAIRQAAETLSARRGGRRRTIRKGKQQRQANRKVHKARKRTTRKRT